MQNCNSFIEQQLKELRVLLKESDKLVSLGKRLPNLRVKVSKSHGCSQYYYIDPETNKYRFLKNISFSGIVNTIKIDLSILMSCKAGFLLTISLYKTKLISKDVLREKLAELYSIAEEESENSHQ